VLELVEEALVEVAVEVEIEVSWLHLLKIRSLRQTRRGSDRSCCHEMFSFRPTLPKEEDTARACSKVSQKASHHWRFPSIAHFRLPLDFPHAKTHVWGMCMTDRHLLAFFRVCPIAGI